MSYMDEASCFTGSVLLYCIRKDIDRSPVRNIIVTSYNDDCLVDDRILFENQKRAVLSYLGITEDVLKN